MLQFDEFFKNEISVSKLYSKILEGPFRNINDQVF